MTPEKKLNRYRGLYRSFARKGGPAPSATHYCPGCGHGILHKLIGEALADLEIQDRSVMISPVGCAVFGYYYFDCGNIQAAHGRGPAVATGIGRALQDAVVVSYQGDGDLCSIGLNEAYQAANRGENMVIIFVNNGIFAMTGGQMAPTSLPGQTTTTTPQGRDPRETGYPVHACELFDTLRAPVYIERCSLADIKRIRRARLAVRKALQIQKERKGFAFVEFLSPCPTNMHAAPCEAADYVTDEMEREFPLGCLRDRTEEATATSIHARTHAHAALTEGLGDCGPGGPDPRPDPEFTPLRIRVAGFGGQGVLSLGMMFALAGQASSRYVTWLPSYGPEQRGGTANCSVVVSGELIGSPLFAECEILVALNHPSLERFADGVTPGGLILHDSSLGELEPRKDVRCLAMPARDIAQAQGLPKAANTAMLGMIAGGETTAMPFGSFREAVRKTFESKPELIDSNLAILEAGRDWAREATGP